MGKRPCCDKSSVRKGQWSLDEDIRLKTFIEKHGINCGWVALPQRAGLKRCSKSCRLRWLNYLRPGLKHGSYTESEDKIICSLYSIIGSRWSVIAGQLQGRTDNDIKNYWNTQLKHKWINMKHKAHAHANANTNANASSFSFGSGLARSSSSTSIFPQSYNSSQTCNTNEHYLSFSMSNVNTPINPTSDLIFSNNTQQFQSFMSPESSVSATFSSQFEAHHATPSCSGSVDQCLDAESGNVGEETEFSFPQGLGDLDLEFPPPLQFTNSYPIFNGEAII